GPALGAPAGRPRGGGARAQPPPRLAGAVGHNPELLDAVAAEAGDRGRGAPVPGRDAPGADETAPPCAVVGLSHGHVSDGPRGRVAGRAARRAAALRRTRVADAPARARGAGAPATVRRAPQPGA